MAGRPAPEVDARSRESPAKHSKVVKRDVMAPSIVYVATDAPCFLSQLLPAAQAAKAAGYVVHVATRLTNDEETVERAGFVSHALAWRRDGLSPLHSLEGMIELRRLLRSLNPEIIHNVALKPVLLGTAASLGLSQCAVVNSITAVGRFFVADDRLAWLARLAVRFALEYLLKRPRSRTIVHNAEDRHFVLKLGIPANTVVVIAESGVDTAHFVPLPEPPPPITAAYVGRLLADEGVTTLVNAFSLLSSRGLKLRLLLVGECDKDNPKSLAPEQLREFASAFDIHWLEHVTDIRDVWREAHFAVLASGRDGLPRSLLEAAACGRAMVATDIPGCCEIAIEGETALTVPVDDVGAFADAMARLAANADLRQRFGQRARQIVEEKYSAEAINRQTIALYESLRLR